MMLEIIKKCCTWLAQKLNIFANLAAENLALRQQLIVLKRNQKRPALKERDRLFWVLLSRIWSGWRDALLIVQPVRRAYATSRLATLATLVNAWREHVSNAHPG